MLKTPASGWPLSAGNARDGAVPEDSDLSLDHPYCIGERAFAIVETRLRAQSPRRILEFGSGRSTVRLCRSFPEARVVTFEHHADYSRQTRALKAENGITDERLRVVHAPLTWQWHGGCRYLSYAPGPIGEPSLDAIIIDGPPGTTLRGREACLYRSYSLLRIGGTVVLDDFRRGMERSSVKNWLSVYPTSFTLDELDDGHGILFMTKVRNERPRFLTPSRWIDNWRVNARLARDRRRSRRDEGE